MRRASTGLITFGLHFLFYRSLRALAMDSRSLKTGPVSKTTAPFPIFHFDNRNLRSLPVDQSDKRGVREVSNAIFSLCTPTPVESPRLIAVSSALRLLEADEPLDFNDEDAIALHFSGNKLMDGSRPMAHCYCGYQFGNFAGQLGDGAAISLGEVINRAGDRWEVQLKVTSSNIR
jgi:uncharacterized protein YdiU (UPF0061 family)